MKKLLIILLLVFTAQHLSAAEVDTMSTPPPAARYNAVKLGASVVSIWVPQVNFSYEQRRARRAWQATVGLGVPLGYNIDDTIRGTALGYALRLDGRFYPSREQKPVNIYVGGGLFYTWFKHPHSGDFYYPTQNFVEKYYYDEYLLMKHTFGAAVNGGFTASISNRFFIDLSAGLGLKLMYTSQRGRLDTGTRISSRGLNVHAVESRLGYEMSVATPVQLSVGYILR